MKKELNLANVLISFIMLTVGIILVINSQTIINMMSWFIGIVIILISIIKTKKEFLLQVRLRF